MPVYEYICKQCGDITEMIRPMANRNAPAACDNCQGRLQFQFAAPRALRTDTAFQRGIHFCDGLKNDWERKRAKRFADKMGVHIEGKKYDARLARFYCDPLAFYGNRQEARAIASRMGLASEDLGVKAPVDEDTGKPYRVANDIVERYAKDKVITEHGGSVPRKKWETIKEEVRTDLSP